MSKEQKSSDKLALPEWAKLNEKDGFVEVDPDIVYPMFLEKAGIAIEKATQLDLERARQAFTNELLKIHGPGLSLRILRNDKWKLAKFPAK